MRIILALLFLPLVACAEPEPTPIPYPPPPMPTTTPSPIVGGIISGTAPRLTPMPTPTLVPPPGLRVTIADLEAAYPETSYPVMKHSHHHQIPTNIPIWSAESQGFSIHTIGPDSEVPYRVELFMYLNKDPETVDEIIEKYLATVLPGWPGMEWLAEALPKAGLDLQNPRSHKIGTLVGDSKVMLDVSGIDNLYIRFVVVRPESRYYVETYIGRPMPIAHLGIEWVDLRDQYDLHAAQYDGDYMRTLWRGRWRTRIVKVWVVRVYLSPRVSTRRVKEVELLGNLDGAAFGDIQVFMKQAKVDWLGYVAWIKELLDSPEIEGSMQLGGAMVTLSTETVDDQRKFHLAVKVEP